MEQTIAQKDLQIRVNIAKTALNRSIFGRSEPIRVEKDVAKYFLLNNVCSIVGATVYPYQIKDIGLGICEVALAPTRYKTHVTKEFIYE